MKILVCLTVVPDTTSKITTDSSEFGINYEGLTMIIGPYDDYALSRAIELKESMGCQVDIVHIGTSTSEVVLKKALALGVDNAYRIDIEPNSSNHVAHELAHFVSQNSYDLILMGKESIDYNSSMVHYLLGNITGIKVYNPVMKLSIHGEKMEITTEVTNGKMDLEIELPAILGCQEPIAEWKIPTMRGIMMARTKTIQVLDAVGKSDKELISSKQIQKERLKKIIKEENAEEIIDILRNHNLIK